MALTILLTILKVLGWILLGILAFIVLILLIVTLVPLRYRAMFHVTKDLNELTLEANASWLLKLIKFMCELEHKEFDARLRIAWKKFPLTGDDEEPETDRKETKKEKEESPKTKEEKKSENTAVSKTEEEEKEDKIKPVQLLEDEEKQKKKEKRKKKEKSSGAKESKKKGRFTFDRIYDTINEIRFAKEEILAFLTEKSHRKIARHFIKRIKKLGHKLLPSRVMIKGELGFDDPCTTARLSAVLSAIYPHIDRIELPELCFDQDIVNLNGDIKGKLRIGSLVVFALPLLLDINLWRTIKDFKSFKKKMDHSMEVIKEGEAA
ncbi:MAG: hypothetical protein IKE02_01030 [Lachnospiraceae bacterium]|nr:hypothetical protein [Lachnospiraceae bacterium]